MRLKKLHYFAVLAALVVLVAMPAHADFFNLPGVVAASGCRVGAVLSTEQFTTTGYSNVRTANPNDEIVAGSWVVVNDFVADTSLLSPPNCNTAAGPIGLRSDLLGMNLIGLRLKPTINSAHEADIREIKLVWDVNVNGLWDPLLDLVLQTKDGSLLDDQDGMIFFNGAQQPIAFLATTGNGNINCIVGRLDGAAAFGIGPGTGTNTRAGADGCYIAFLAIAVIGDNPNTGSQFGLELEALAADVPGTTGVDSYTFSSGFSSSLNPQGSNVRLHMVGGNPSSHTPLSHISNGSGTPESVVSVLTFSGGQQGEGLLSRFRALEIVPGTREVIAMAVGICEGGYLANDMIPILPPIAGAPPTVAGGLASLPCVAGAGSDGFATGINGATLIFRGPLARYMGTVRMYADECSPSGGPGAGNAGICDAIGNPGAVLAAPIVATDTGGGDGFLFQAGEQVEQNVPIFNEETGEAIVQFGGRQEQILYTGNGNPVANGSDPNCIVIGGACAAITPGARPLVLIWTVDIDENAPGGLVDVVLGLQSFDDTAINSATGGAGQPCVIFAASAPTVPLGPPIAGPIGGPGSCGSNFLDTEAELYSFSVEAPVTPSTPNNLNAFDTNNSCFIDDPEFFAMIDQWVDAQIGDTLFFSGVDAWVAQENICAASASSVSTLRLDRVDVGTHYNSTTFSVTGQGIEAMGFEIYSLSGDVVYSDQSEGAELSWAQMNSHGAPVANGTYLYAITVRGADGQILQSEIGKLAVLR